MTSDQPFQFSLGARSPRYRGGWGRLGACLELTEHTEAPSYPGLRPRAPGGKQSKPRRCLPKPAETSPPARSVGGTGEAVHLIKTACTPPVDMLSPGLSNLLSGSLGSPGRWRGLGPRWTGGVSLWHHLALLGTSGCGWNPRDGGGGGPGENGHQHQLSSTVKSRPALSVARGTR